MQYSIQHFIMSLWSVKDLLSLSLMLPICLCFAFVSFLSVSYTVCWSLIQSSLACLVFFLISLSIFLYCLAPSSLLFALLPFYSFITKVKDVCCDTRFLFGSVLTKYFPCIFCHCCIKCTHSIISANIIESC